MANKSAGHLKLEAAKLEAAGWTVSQLAKKYGKSIRTIEGWLRDARGPKQPEAKKTKAILEYLENNPDASLAEIAQVTDSSEVLANKVRHEFRNTRPAEVRTKIEIEEAFIAGTYKDFFQIGFPALNSLCGRVMSRSLKLLDDEPLQGLRMISSVIPQMQERLKGIRNHKNYNVLRQKVSVSLGLQSSGFQKANSLDKARKSLDYAWDYAKEDAMCHAECMRHEGWLQLYLEKKEAGVEWLSKAAKLYETFDNYVGLNPHGNGLASSLVGRSTILFYQDKHEQGLADTNDALNILDPSSGLIVPTIHTHAWHLAKLPGRKPEAVMAAKDLLSGMKPDDSVPYAKVLWLHGLLESKSRTLKASRKILLKQGMDREVAIISVDICLIENSTEFLRSVPLFGDLRHLIPVLQKRWMDWNELIQIRRDKLKGDDVMPLVLVAPTQPGLLLV